MDSESEFKGLTKARTSSKEIVRPEEPQAMGGGRCPGPGVSKPRWVTLKKGEFNGKRILDLLGRHKWQRKETLKHRSWYLRDRRKLQDDNSSSNPSFHRKAVPTR